MKDIITKITEVSHNTGRIKEYDVNRKKLQNHYLMKLKIGLKV